MCLDGDDSAGQRAGGQLLGKNATQRRRERGEGAEYNVRALRGVVIATGGFDHNAEMVNSFLRGPIYYPSAVRGNTGDGHLMGMALGANLQSAVIGLDTHVSFSRP